MTQVDLLLQPLGAEEHAVQEAAKEVKNQICPSGGIKPGLQRGYDQSEQNYPCNQRTVSPKSIKLHTMHSHIPLADAVNAWLFKLEWRKTIIPQLGLGQGRHG